MRDKVKAQIETDAKGDPVLMITADPRDLNRVRNCLFGMAPEAIKGVIIGPSGTINITERPPYILGHMVAGLRRANWITRDDEAGLVEALLPFPPKDEKVVRIERDADQKPVLIVAGLGNDEDALRAARNGIGHVIGHSQARVDNSMRVVGEELRIQGLSPERLRNVVTQALRNDLHWITADRETALRAELQSTPAATRMESSMPPPPPGIPPAENGAGQGQAATTAARR